MLSLPSSVQIYLARDPCDMRRGIDGLCAAVLQQHYNLYSGALFVFISKHKNRIKILTFDNGGFVLYFKRLERGRFKLPPLDKSAIRLHPTDLLMLLDGVDLNHLRRTKLWDPQTIDSDLYP